MTASVFVGRVGGLAVALGVGAVLGGFGMGLAAASPASPQAASAASPCTEAETRSRAISSTSKPAAVSSRSKTAASEAVDPLANISKIGQSKSSAALSRAAVIVPFLAAAKSTRVDIPLSSVTTKSVPVREFDDVGPENPSAVKGLAIEAVSFEPVASALPIAATGVVESGIPTVHGADSSTPAALSLAWTALTATHRERGFRLSVSRLPMVPVSVGALLDAEVVRPFSLTSEKANTADVSLEAVNPAAAVVAVDPIAAIFQQFQAVFGGIVQAITQFIAAIVNIFSPAAQRNSAPTVTASQVGLPDPRTGTVTGSVSATDVDGDTLTFSAPALTAKGSVIINANSGVFTYTPTSLARQNAAQVGATASDKADTFIVTITDGKDESTTTAVTVTISPSYPANTVVTKLEVSSVYSAPRGLAISPDGKRVYVLNAGGGQVPVIDTATNTLTNPLTVTTQTGFTPVALAVNADGTRLYAAIAFPNVIGASFAGNLSLVNIATNTILATREFDDGINPRALAISPDGKKLYVASSNTSGGDGRVWVIDTNTNATIQSLYGVTPRGLSVSPDNERLYVSTTAGSLLFIDTETLATTGGVSNVGEVFAVSNDGERVYTSSSGVISTIDVATNAVIGTLTIGSSLSVGLAVSPDGQRLYVADYYRGLVAVIDTNTNTVVTTIPVDPVPSALTLSPDGTRLYVASSAGGTVAVIAT